MSSLNLSKYVYEIEFLERAKTMFDHIVIAEHRDPRVVTGEIMGMEGKVCLIIRAEYAFFYAKLLSHKHDHLTVIQTHSGVTGYSRSHVPSMNDLDLISYVDIYEPYDVMSFHTLLDKKYIRLASKEYSIDSGIPIADLIDLSPYGISGGEKTVWMGGAHIDTLVSMYHSLPQQFSGGLIIKYSRTMELGNTPTTAIALDQFEGLFSSYLSARFPNLTLLFPHEPSSYLEEYVMESANFDFEQIYYRFIELNKGKETIDE